MKKKLIAGGADPLHISALCMPDRKKTGENRESKNHRPDIHRGKGTQQI